MLTVRPAMSAPPHCEVFAALPARWGSFQLIWSVRWAATPLPTHDDGFGTPNRDPSTRNHRPERSLTMTLFRLLACLLACELATGAKNNVVHIMVDDLRPGEVSSHCVPGASF